MRSTGVPARMNCDAVGSSVRAHGDSSLIMADMISGINIPDSKIAREAAELVRQYETEMLFNHSVRVFVFGAMKGLRQKIKFDSELLYVAALFHGALSMLSIPRQTDLKSTGPMQRAHFSGATASPSRKRIWCGKRSPYIPRQASPNTCDRKLLSRMRVF